MASRSVRTIGWVLAGIVGCACIGTVATYSTRSMVPVSLQSGSVWTGSWEGYVVARGTWIMDDEQIYSPLQTSQIICRKPPMTCVGADAELFSGTLLSVNVREYYVNNWDSNTITFTLGSRCVEYIYTIDRRNERVIGTRKTLSTSGECLPLSDKPIKLSLSDGFKVWQQLYKDAQNKTSSFMFVGWALCWAFVIHRIWGIWRQAHPLVTTADGSGAGAITR
jgi:hypothetical protein